MSSKHLLELKKIFQSRLQAVPEIEHWPHLYRAHVAVIIHSNSDGNLSMITIKRSEHPLDPWSGHIALPGGMAHRGEEPLSTVTREVQEELGLSLRPSTFLGSLECFETISQRENQSLLVRPEIFFVTDPIEFNLLKPQPGEVDLILSSTFHDLLLPERATKYSLKKEGIVYKLPARELEVGLMWGLTYRIVSHLFERFKGLPIDLEAKQLIDLNAWEMYPDTPTLRKYTNQSE
jgi:8-oxo-dGTP pyrophosphatase MutT (NUDIX family)